MASEKINQGPAKHPSTQSKQHQAGQYQSRVVNHGCCTCLSGLQVWKHVKKRCIHLYTGYSVPQSKSLHLAKTKLKKGKTCPIHNYLPNSWKLRLLQALLFPSSTAYPSCRHPVSLYNYHLLIPGPESVIRTPPGCLLNASIPNNFLVQKYATGF